MNQTGYQYPQPNDKLINYHDDVIWREINTLYQFAEKSLLTYRVWIYAVCFIIRMRFMNIFTQYLLKAVLSC